MSSESMLDKLNRYYHEQGISPVGFNCPHFSQCSSKCAEGRMATAQAPFVGPGYEDGGLPRVLFVSSDTCDAWYIGHPEWVTLESIRHLTIEKGLADRAHNTHWYKTYDLARWLLAPYAKVRLEKEWRGIDVKKVAKEVASFFAHTRTVRCKDSCRGTREGPVEMANNCRGFLKREIEIMHPDIIVVQGARAGNALLNAFPVVRQGSMPEYPDTLYQIVQIEPAHTALKIVAKHPCARGRKGWKRGEWKQFMDWAARGVQDFRPTANG